VSAPYRIRKPKVSPHAAKSDKKQEFQFHSKSIKVAQFTVPSDEQQEFKFYLDRLTRMIPGEVISLYLVGNGFIPLENGLVQIIWAIFCLVAVVMIRSYGSSDPKKGLKPQWETVIISAIAFLIWVYSLGGVFATFKLYVPYIGSLLVLSWTFLIPYLYKGSNK
jgi:hypothetical protein